MRRFFASLIVFFCASLLLEAQVTLPEGYAILDSLVFIPASDVDTSIVGGIFENLPAEVTVMQSDGVKRALLEKAERNRESQVRGYRIRIYFDNKQVSRKESEEIAERFREKYPGVPVYRSFSSPFFKVTVGNYRTKSEALSELSRYRSEFTSAFLVRETFKYPSVDGAFSFKVDTVKVIRKIAEE